MADSNSQNTGGGLTQVAKSDLAKLLEPIPSVGPVLAFLFKHVSLRAMALTAFLFVILPILTPLLGAAYIKALPSPFREMYTDFVIDAYSVEALLKTQVAAVVEENKSHLDYVQQFHTEWSDPKRQRPFIYEFPRMPDQKFRVEFSVAKPVSIANACSTTTRDPGLAEQALADPKLFKVKLDGNVLEFESGADGVDGSGDAYAIESTLEYWKKLNESLNGGGTGKVNTGRVTVQLNTQSNSDEPSLAEKVLKCYRLATDVRVIVYKSLVSDDAARTVKVATNSATGAWQ